MFTSTFQLFSRRAAFSGVRAHGKLLQNPELVFSRLLVGIGLAYYQVRLVHDAALYDQPQGGYVEIYLAHLFGCLEEGGQRLETEIADGVETRMRADAVMRWISDFDTCDRAYSVSMNFLNSLSHSSVCCFVGSHEAYNFSKYFISLVSRGLSLPYRAVINTLPIGIFTGERQERKFTCQVLLMTQR